MSNDADQRLAFQAPPKGTPYLGDHAVVAGLINEFADDVLTIYHEFTTGRPGADKPLTQINDMAKDYGDIFMGRKPNRYAPAPWNTRTRLGVRLRAAVDEIKGDEDPGEAYFRWLALQITRAGKALDDGMAPEQVGPILRAILDDAIGRLLAMVL